MVTPQVHHRLSPDVLKPLIDTGLFYPCCGQDLEDPIRLVAPYVSDFLFVDTRKPARPALRNFARPIFTSRSPGAPDVLQHLQSGREFRVHRIQRRAEEYRDDLSEIGVFFFRGDNPVTGEGSSGILWLGQILFSRVVELLVPGGLVITDGSNPGPGGPTALSDFYTTGRWGGPR